MQTTSSAVQGVQFQVIRCTEEQNEKFLKKGVRQKGNNREKKKQILFGPFILFVLSPPAICQFVWRDFKRKMFYKRNIQSSYYF